VGDYLKAAEVNAMLDDPDAVFIDMRNHYEYEVGHFENALEIPADTFRDQLPKAVEMMQEHKDKKIVMYCTGGIRCEKASAWMKQTASIRSGTLRAGSLSTPVAPVNRGCRYALSVRTLSLMSGWASVSPMTLSPLPSVRRAVRHPYQLPERWLPSAVYPVPELRREVCRLL
jgi:rhodanese-related sulfurtransferase